MVSDEVLSEEQNLQDEFSELTLGFLDWFSNLIRFKGTNHPVFGGENSTGGPWDDVTKGIHKISPLDAPLPVQKSEPMFISFSLTKSFLESADFEMTSLPKRNELCKGSLQGRLDTDLILRSWLLLILHRELCCELDWRVHPGGGLLGFEFWFCHLVFM